MYATERGLIRYLFRLMHRILLIATILWSACSGVHAQAISHRPTGPFTQIKVSEGITVQLSRGEREAIRLKVQGTEAEKVHTVLMGEVLKIFMEPGHYKGVVVEAEVTYRELKAVLAGSGARVFATGVVTADSLFIRAGSAARVELAVKTEKTEADISSSAEVKLEGYTRRLDARVYSSGTLQALGLQADQVRVKAGSAGLARVFAQNQLDAEASTAATILYMGNPQRSAIQSLTAGMVRRLD